MQEGFRKRSASHLLGCKDQGGWQHVPKDMWELSPATFQITTSLQGWLLQDWMQACKEFQKAVQPGP